MQLEKKRVSEILAGKGASKAGREFARMPFGTAADLFTEERKPHVSERTTQLDRERLKPLRLYFGETPLLRIKASDISAYQRARLSGQIRLKTATAKAKSKGVGNRTANMEITVLRQMMRESMVGRQRRRQDATRAARRGGAGAHPRAERIAVPGCW